MDDFDIPLIKKLYELYKEFYVCLKSFPKQDRYTLGIRSQEVILAVLASCIRASQVLREAKLSHLQQASVELTLLRIFLRLGKDTRAMDEKRYLALQALADEIGRQLGGWMRTIKAVLK